MVAALLSEREHREFENLRLQVELIRTRNTTIDRADQVQSADNLIS